MILRGFRLRNYRAFVREVSVPLRPLTLLFGFNSAGKSAVLRALPLIAESIRGTGGPLALGGKAVAGSNFFREVRTRWSPGDSLSMGLDWAAEDASLDVEITDHASMQRQVIETYRIRDAARGERGFALDIAAERTPDVSTYSLGEARGRILFEGWCAREVQGFDGDAVAHLADVNVRLERLAKATAWLGERALPKAPIALAGASRVGDDGSGTIEVLAREKLLPSSEVLDVVRAWFQRATEHDLDVRQQSVSSGPVFHVELRPLRAPGGIRLADTGDGMTQVLPVITLGALAEKGRLGDSPLLVIEHPELHLHPRAHQHVADFLVRVARQATVVVETHSENSLLAVQLAIAAGTIPASDVMVHWIQGTDEGPSFIEPITFDDQARPSRWPPGVFAEDRELARKLIERRHGLTPS
jgi:hypothetical protein